MKWWVERQSPLIKFGKNISKDRNILHPSNYKEISPNSDRFSSQPCDEETFFAYSQNSEHIVEIPTALKVDKAKIYLEPKTGGFLLMMCIE